MGTWEYQTIHVKGDPTELGNLGEANELGAERWEAFAVTEDNTGWWVFLKRPTNGVMAAAASPTTTRSRGRRSRR
jgi:hypothetical protein